MSERLPSRQQALMLLRRSGCRENVIKHSEAVSKLAVEIGQTCKHNGHDVDLELIEIGALLHDIGRSKTHSVHHAVVGAEIAKSLGIPEPIVLIIKRHVGGGIVTREAKRLGWPRDVYVPETLEEKIITYADKLIEGSRRVPIEKGVRHLSEKLPPHAVERIWRLHSEMLTLIGDCPCLP